MIKLMARIGALIFSLGLIALMLLPMLPWISVPAYDTLIQDEFSEEDLQPSYTLIDEVLFGRVSTFAEKMNSDLDFTTGVLSIVRNVLRSGFAGAAIFNIIVIIFLIVSVKWARRIGIVAACLSFLVGATFIVGTYYLNIQALIEFDLNSLIQPTLFAYIFPAASIAQGILCYLVYKKPVEEEQVANAAASYTMRGKSTARRSSKGSIQSDDRLRSVLIILIILIMLLLVGVSIVLFLTVVPSVFNI